MIAPAPAQPLRGRGDELGRASAFLRRAKETGQGAILTIAGEPGIGKTAVLNAIAGEAAALGFSVGVGKAEELDQIAPLAPLLVALRSGIKPVLSRDEFAQLAPLYGQHLWLIDRLTGMLEEHSLNAPVLVVIDDVQWADDLSVFALRVMPGRLVGAPVVWVFATRFQPAGVIAKIAAGQSNDMPIEAITLGPLPPSAIELLAIDRYGERPSERLQELLQHAGGVPFLAVELLDGYSRESAASVERELDAKPRSTLDGDDIPVQLIERVRSRLASLTPEALEFVQKASILGRSFVIEDAAALLEIEPWTDVLPSLGAAIRAGIVEDDGTRVAFRHDLFRLAVYEDVSPSVRKVLHRAAALRFLQMGRSATDAATHVLRYAARGDREAVDILRRAAASASDAPTLRAQLLERAFALLDSADAVWHETGQELTAALIADRRVGDATQLANRLLATTMPTDRAASIQALIIRCLWGIGYIDEMRARLHVASKLEPLSPKPRAELQSLRALALSTVDFASAITAAESALTFSRSASAHEAEADALRALGEASRNDGRNEDAFKYFRQLRALVSTTTPADEVISLLQLDQFEATADLLAAARLENAERPDRARSFGIAFGQMWYNSGVGSLEDTEAEAKTLIQLSEDFQENRFQHEAQLLLCRIEQLRGDLSAARTYLKRSETHLNDNDDSWRQRLLIMQAWLAESEGEPDKALRLTRDSVRRSGGGRHRYRLIPGWILVATRIAMRGSDLELANEVATLAGEISERNPKVATLKGVALHTRGLVDGDLHMMMGAADVLKASPRRIIRAEAALDRGRVQLSGGDRGLAIATFDDALETFIRLKAHGFVRMVQQLLQDAGVRHPRQIGAPRALTGWEALTATEQRVARLVAHGSTNRMAAAELGISPNTIATHLRATFGKLDVNSRSQLTRIVVSENR